MYDVAKVIKATEIGANADSMLSDVDSDKDGNVYILDSGTSKVYILNSEYKLTSTISELKYNGNKISFNEAQGIFVDANKKIYIADTENKRVLVLNNNGTVENQLLLPDSQLIPTDFQFKPVKVAVDSDGYTYIASDGSYYGAILYSPELEFLGFFGANSVKSSALDVFQSVWKRLTSNDVKRAADELSLPYAFSDIVIGPDNFVYTTTSAGSKSAIQTGQLSVLNPGGRTTQDSSGFNFADTKFGTYQFTKLTQSLANLDVDENGFVYALDSAYGRVFWYDSDWNLLSVFGGSAGPGQQNGTFTLPSALTINNGDVLVTDSKKNTLTVFGLTDYGALVRNTDVVSINGNYKQSKESWEKIISLDSNCQVAYRGVAKAYLEIDDYHNAIKYAKLGVDRDTYSKSYKSIRGEIAEKNFPWILLGIILLTVAIIFVKLKIKKNNRNIIQNPKIKNALSSVFHPVECFRRVKELGEGSLIIATVVLALFYVITVMNDTRGGFAFTVFDSENYNAFYVFLSTIGFVVLWSISNWLVCTLAGGIGKIKEIYVVTCYSLIPVLFARTVRIILTHVLVPDEAAFLSIFVTVCTIYTVFMLIIGIMKIHDFEFGKFLFTTILTFVGMIIIVFLIFLMFMLIQQVGDWVSTVYTEIRFR